MLSRGCDDVIARSQKAVQGRIEAVGTAGRKDDLPRVAGCNQPRDAGPRGLDDSARLEGLAIRPATGGRSDVALKSIDSEIDGLGFRPTGGGVVEVDSANCCHTLILPSRVKLWGQFTPTVDLLRCKQVHQSQKYTSQFGGTEPLMLNHGEKGVYL